MTAARSLIGSTAVAAAALVVVGCLPTAPPEEVETTTQTFDLSDGEPQYIDLFAGSGTAEAWDIRAEGWDLFLNGGESGVERAGGIDMELLDLEMPFEELNRKNQMLYFFFYDSYACAVSDWWWYALDGTHTLFSNYHVYVVRRGDRDFVVQMLDYYRVIDGSAQAGYPQFRWAEVPTDGSALDIFTEDIDATAGGLGADAEDPDNRWAYFSFDDGVIDLTDAEALDDDRWDIGFKRFNVKSNSGPSGPGGLVTADFDLDRGETAEQVLDFTPDSQLPHLEARASDWAIGGDAVFEEDAIRPVLRRWSTGVPGAGAPPELDPGRWFLVSDRTGLGLAKLRVIELEGDSESGPTTITVEWAVLE